MNIVLPCLISDVRIRIIMNAKLDSVLLVCVELALLHNTNTLIHAGPIYHFDRVIATIFRVSSNKKLLHGTYFPGSFYKLTNRRSRDL